MRAGAGERQGTCTERGTGTVVPWTLALALALAQGVGVHRACTACCGHRVDACACALCVVCKDKDKGEGLWPDTRH
jgi:hypothetical protein